MAIAFTTGTINQPDAGSVGLAMVERIRDDLVAHAAWDLVEEYFPAGGAVRWYVFKCLATQSGLSNDFYLVIGRTLGNGELRFFIAETYNSSTHVVGKYAQAAASSTAVVFDSVGRIADATTYTLSTVVLPNTANTPLNSAGWIPSGTSTKWWLIVDNDGFTVAFNGASNGVVHCGAYVSISTLTNLMPIHIFSSLTGNWDGHITRNPAMAGVNYFGAALHTQNSSGTGIAPVLGFSGELQFNDALQGGQRLVAEQGFTIKNTFGQSAQYPITGWGVGKVKRMRSNFTTPPVGVAFGDAYALQGRLWVPYLPTDGRMWDTGVVV